MHLTPNAQLVINSGDRTRYVNPGTTTFTQKTISQPYSEFQLSNAGQNLVQGSIDKVQVAEVNFPYDICNVIYGITDTFYVGLVAQDTPFYPVTIPQGFYTGSEMVAALQTAMNAVWTAQFAAEPIPTVSYNPASNTFTFSLAAGGTGNEYFFFPMQPNVANPSPPPTNVSAPAPSTQGATVPKSLLSIMGFVPGNADITLPSILGFSLAPASSQESNSAPLIYTQFIDIVSKALCGNVYITDGSTQINGFRKDLLARLYISDETSSQVGYVYDASGNPMLAPVGTRPFVIHRQFKNAKVIPNNLLNSLNLIDVQLRDDCGYILATPTFGGGQTPRNFQITLNVFETDRTNTVNVPSSGYGNY